MGLEPSPCHWVRYKVLALGPIVRTILNTLYFPGGTWLTRRSPRSQRQLVTISSNPIPSQLQLQYCQCRRFQQEKAKFRSPMARSSMKKNNSQRGTCNAQRAHQESINIVCLDLIIKWSKAYKFLFECNIYHPMLVPWGCVLDRPLNKRLLSSPLLLLFFLL